jgi:hypothetical protein
MILQTFLFLNRISAKKILASIILTILEVYVIIYHLFMHYIGTLLTLRIFEGRQKAQKSPSKASSAIKMQLPPLQQYVILGHKLSFIICSA